jgi:hypothetical protein
MSTTYYLKHLRLAPAELANALDIPAEAPVFLSPVVNAPQRCSICAVTVEELHPGMFVPMCEDAVREPHAVAFRFQIRDGTVYFSQP